MLCPKCKGDLSDDMNFCPFCGYPIKGIVREEFSVSSDNLIKKVKQLIHEGNVTKIIVKSEDGRTFLEIPVTVGIIGALLAPQMAALGVIAALVTKCKITVERAGG